jgi:two-component system LytT family response regulator/two-component system response regulator AlgR
VSKPLSAIIVDDEPLATRRLRLALAGLPTVRVVGAAGNGQEALELIRSARPDLVFLDIKMPMLSGLEVARALTEADAPAVIFVTAFANYAADAFRVDAVDYLLKPVEFERVRVAVERAERLLAARNAAERVAELQQLIAQVTEPEAAAASSPRHLNDIWAADRGGRTRIQIGEIIWIEAERDYVRIHTRSRSHLLRETLQNLMQQLDPTVFVRVHRSAAVNLTRLQRVERRGRGGAELVLENGAVAPVGRRYAAQVREALAQLQAR